MVWENQIQKSPQRELSTKLSSPYSKPFPPVSDENPPPSYAGRVVPSFAQSHSSLKVPSSTEKEDSIMEMPIQFLKGVGPPLARHLVKKGIHTLGDLLETYPTSYQDRRADRCIANLQPGETVRLLAEVVQVNTHHFRRTMWDVKLQDHSGSITARYFRTPYRGYFHALKPGLPVQVEGKVIKYRGQLQFHHPDISVARENREVSDDVVPRYSDIEGISAKKFLSIMQTALKKGQGQISEILPSWLRQQYQLITKEEALRGIHNPTLPLTPHFLEHKSPFHRRLQFEEFFLLQMVVCARKSQLVGAKAYAIPKLSQEDKAHSLAVRLLESFGFSLTQAQQKVCKEIFGDLHNQTPMHRLIQGDVGCGKTVLAFLSAARVIEAGFQVALMAPTEILATQHAKKAREVLEPFGISIELLTSSTPYKKEILSGLRSGRISFCIGTHALIQEQVEFRHLALAIIDEQHRFGVHQRRKLRSVNADTGTTPFEPHLLVMTATPIPRSLAMTFHGDLNVSIVAEKPHGRLPIKTQIMPFKKQPQIITFVKEQLQQGRQAYVVYPLVQESEKLDLKDAMTGFERLKVAFAPHTVGLVHGQMPSHEKDNMMSAFQKGQCDVLVSTTVIEVGVDVPNATIMWIEHAERFGLSQLHQLRGRVGRGPHQSHCFLSTTGQSYQRLKILERTNDGFAIADYDLACRGPGDFLGTRQSGALRLRMAQWVRDTPVLIEARKAAQTLLERDPRLEAPESQPLKTQLLAARGAWDMSTSG